MICNIKRDCYSFYMNFVTSTFDIVYRQFILMVLFVPFGTIEATTSHKKSSAILDIEKIYFILGKFSEKHTDIEKYIRTMKK